MRKIKLIICFLLIIMFLNCLRYFGDFQVDNMWLYITGTQTIFGDVTFETKSKGYLEIMVEDELGKREKTVKLSENQCRCINEKIELVEKYGRDTSGEDGIQVWCRIGDKFAACFFGDDYYESDRYLNELACELLKTAPMRIDLKPQAYMYEFEDAIEKYEIGIPFWNFLVTLYGFPWTYIY